MPVYRHRQIGIVVLSALGVGVVGMGLILIQVAASSPGSAGVPAAILAVLISCAWLFGTLTVEVSEERVGLWFGPGLIRMRFSVGEIRGARVVRNRWYYGWGIRMTPSGWLFNVSGLDAVEIELASGRKCQIGTDEPQQLLSAIQRVLRTG